ncbi:MAG: hypothetical protein ABIG71_03875 [Candidatus Uhrbacteria bacterium]
MLRRRRASARKNNKRHTHPHRIERDTVERIYRDKQGKMPDFSHLDRRPSGWRRWALSGALVTLGVLAIAAWASFLIFKPYSDTTDGDVVVRIDAPPAADIGGTVTYTITVANNDRVPIAAAELELHLPEHFLLATADPAPTTDDPPTWMIGSLDRGERTTIVLSGQLFGTPGADATINAELFYRPGNFNAEFQEYANATTILGASPFTLTMTGPDRTVPGELVTYSLHYERTLESGGTGVWIALTAPHAFTMKDSAPKQATGNDVRWSITNLDTHPSGDITFSGTFFEGSAEPYLLRTEAQTQPAEGVTIAFNSAEVRTEVVGGGVTIIGTANDQTNDFAVRSGDTLRFRVSVRNDGNIPIRNVTVNAILDAASISEQSILNYSAMTDPADGAAVGEQRSPELRRGTITWTSAEVPGLIELAPGATETVNFSIPIHTSTSLRGFDGKGGVQFKAIAQIGATGDLEKPYTVQTSPMTLTVQ